MGYHQKAREIVLVCFDAFGQNLQSEFACRVGVADAGNAALLLLRYFVGAFGGVVGFDEFQVRVLSQKIGTLQQRHVVRVHFADVVDALPGQGYQTLFDAQFVLADNP